MAEILAYCGLICSTCPIYLATRQENEAERTRMRVEIARLCREQYGMNYSQDDITDCDGCLAGGERLFSACTTCPIRKCARERGLENCAHCSEYTCQKLEAFFVGEPSAETRLEGIRSNKQV